MHRSHHTESVGRALVLLREQWLSGAIAQAEAKLDDTDMKLITSIVRKDRGPILYWLANERRPAFAFHAGHAPNVSRATEHCQIASLSHATSVVSHGAVHP